MMVTREESTAAFAAVDAANASSPAAVAMPVAPSNATNLVMSFNEIVFQLAGTANKTDPALVSTAIARIAGASRGGCVNPLPAYE